MFGKDGQHGLGMLFENDLRPIRGKRRNISQFLQILIKMRIEDVAEGVMAKD